MRPWGWLEKVFGFPLHQGALSLCLSRTLSHTHTHSPSSWKRYIREDSISPYVWFLAVFTQHYKHKLRKSAEISTQQRDPSLPHSHALTPNP